MKQFIFALISVIAFAIVPQTINAQGLSATYGATQKNNIKISNSHYSIYIDGLYRGLQINGKKVEGMVALGKDKHGNIWLGNMSDYRIELRVEWTEVGKGTLHTGGIVDPWEISRLKDPKGNLVPNEARILGITYIKGH